MPMGIIYIAQNQTYGPNVYKIGKTERTNIDERMQEITGATGVLGEFKLLGHSIVNDVDHCERKCHDVLREFRIQQNREFFNINLERLVPIIRETILDKIFIDKLPEVEIFLHPSHIIWMAITIGLQKIYLGDNVILKDFCSSYKTYDSRKDLERMPPQHSIDQWPLLSHMHYDTGWDKKRHWDETVDWAITHNLENALKKFLDDLSREDKEFASKKDAIWFFDKTTDFELEQKKLEEDGWGPQVPLEYMNNKSSEVPVFKILFGNETFNVSTHHFIEDGKLKEDLWPPTSLNNQGGNFIENARKFYGKPKIWTGWKIDKKNKKLLYIPHSKEFPIL
mgnify:FL=1